MYDFQDCRLRPSTIRGIVIAVAYGKPFLLLGPPGAGKTMIARRLNSLLPAMGSIDSAYLAHLYSEAWVKHAPKERPFRAPHHTCSGLSLAGTTPREDRPSRPGEVALATHGTLFLDELPEFRHETVEATAFALKGGRPEWPMPPKLMVASANPCPCGYCGDPTVETRCSNKSIEAFRARLHKFMGILGIEVVVRVPRVRPSEAGTVTEFSSVMRRRVERVREVCGTDRPADELLPAMHAVYESTARVQPRHTGRTNAMLYPFGI